MNYFNEDEIEVGFSIVDEELTFESLSLLDKVRLAIYYQMRDFQIHVPENSLSAVQLAQHAAEELEEPLVEIMERVSEWEVWANESETSLNHEQYRTNLRRDIANGGPGLSFYNIHSIY